MSILTNGIETIETGATGWVHPHQPEPLTSRPKPNHQRLYSARPAAGKSPRFYYATDIQELYYDNNSAWVVVGLQAKTPASATATGYAYDSSYLYICTGTNVWKRLVLTW